MNEEHHILIVGGGTAGWLTAGYLARMLGADRPGGISVTLIESSDIGILGVGEGTFPTIRNTLSRIGIDEAEMIRQCGAAFKHGAMFADWQNTPGTQGPDHYFHGFQETGDQGGPELLPYWLLGVASNTPWADINTPQKRAADASRAPKLPSHPDFAGPLNYAFHFDAATLAVMLRDQGIRNGVKHLTGTITNVELAEDGSIAGVDSAEHGRLTASLYIDCTGFRAALIGRAMDVPWNSCQDTLFCDRAVALQAPYETPDAPIKPYTLSTAQEAGWIWDIGLETRRGLGHVYSSAHTDADTAEQALRHYAGAAGKEMDARHFSFKAGYRKVNWQKNCVAIGLSSGFFEPLEATGIVFSEIAATLVANLYPWAGDLETSARQFNRIMLQRYERARDFIKMHYFLSKRRDSQFWIDNANPDATPDSLHELLDRWRYRPPNEMDFDTNIDIFTQSSWQYVLYGMGWKTDLSHKAGFYRYHEDARAAFAKIDSQAAYAINQLPSNRELVSYARDHSFGGHA
ncbi:tryptophan 7-halogenase [Parvularcula flava]|uniref:Tryptophan 7-halogenase n=1 Tax=Aquisalinus luteolus TaxID=1566827 RepID=A0A8J3A6D5_9PROT|nr:tryptophan halogenase family protein [Aquisalinus luteolus]NHK29657.1 tryptophan 7-halogenase [Aquisalinus luteolus]GGI02193.1 tryptophan halogenase [Aquisalinus luteolus]